MAVGVGDILRVAARWTVDGISDIVNVWHFDIDDLGTTTGDDDVMAALADILGVWYDTYMNSVSNRILAADLSGVNLTKDELLPVTAWDGDGSSAAEGLPLQTTPMIQLHSAVPRHGSRIYLPPVQEAHNNFGVLDGTLITELGNMVADLLAGFTDVATGLDCRRVSYDRQTAIPYALLSSFIPNTFRTQRRRRQGVGS